MLFALDDLAVHLDLEPLLGVPDYNAIHYPGLALSFIAEAGLALWLLVKGVKVVDAGAGLPAETGPGGPQAEGARA